MSYKNPLHIIRDKDLSSVTPENLKRWRKELMLRFNLGGGTAINVNGKEYDKQGVLDAFEGMQGDLSLHARILENESLLHFLEDGDLQLFNGVNAFDGLSESGLFEEVKDLFISSLSEALVKSYRKKNSEAATQVGKVFRFSDNLEEQDKNACFSALYGELSLDVISLKQMSQDPFVGGKKLAIKPELVEYLNKDRLAFLKKLPSEFFDLINQYGQAAYRIVYALYQQRQTNHIGLDMQTLEILEAGVNISFFGASANNLRWLKQKSKELKNIIWTKRRGWWGKYGEPLVGGCLIWVVIFTLIFIALSIKHSGKKTASSSNIGGIVMDSVIDDDYWSKAMLGLFETKGNNGIRRELLFDENGQGQALWKIRDEVLPRGLRCRIIRSFEWKIIKKQNNENSELSLKYDTLSEACNSLYELYGLKEEQFPLAVNWFQHPEGFRFGKTEFTLKRIDTIYLSQYPDASENLRLKIKRKEYLHGLQNKILASDYINKKLYSVVSVRDYSILSLHRKSGMGRSKIAEIKDIDAEPYLEFFEYGSEMPQGSVYLDFKNIRYKNRRGEIVVGDARVFKTTNRKVVLLGD